MAGRLQDQVAVITAAGQGIGRAISVALKNAGYTVIANYGSDDAKADAKADTKADTKKSDSKSDAKR